MKDTSIKIPLFFAALPVLYFLLFTASAPTKQFVEGVVASSTAVFMEPITGEVEETATTTTSEPSFEVASTTENEGAIDVVISSSSATSTEVDASAGTSTATSSAPAIDDVYIATTTASTTVSTDTTEAEVTDGESTDVLIVEEVQFETEPIETIQKRIEPTYEELEVDDSLYRVGTQDLENPTECQSNTLSRKYRNPGECIRAWRETRSY